MKDYYVILGVPRNAEKEDIKKAYRKLAHQFHPDKKGGDEKKFKEINEAYQVLGDDSKRSQYDKFGRTFDGSAGKSGFEGFDFSGFSGFGKGFNSQNFEFDLNDVFSEFFGGKSSRTRAREGRRGSDIQVDMSVNLEEAFRGIEKEISLKKYVVCEVCSGRRNEPGTVLKLCSKCNGRGEIKMEQKMLFGSFSQVIVCVECGGTGKIPEKKCSKCKGMGRVQNIEKINIRIPAGIRSGEIIQFTGKGEMGDGSAGNLYVRIRVKEHLKFERHDDDIYSNETIGVSQAALGDKIKVETLGGVHEVHIPNGFQSGGMIKLFEKGMPRMGRSGTGDHYVRINVKIPEHLSKKAKQLFEDLKKENI